MRYYTVLLYIYVEAVCVSLCVLPSSSLSSSLSLFLSSSSLLVVVIVNIIMVFVLPTVAHQNIHRLSSVPSSIFCVRDVFSCISQPVVFYYFWERLFSLFCSYLINGRPFFFSPKNSESQQHLTRHTD